MLKKLDIFHTVQRPRRGLAHQALAAGTVGQFSGTYLAIAVYTGRIHLQMTGLSGLYPVEFAAGT